MTDRVQGISVVLPAGGNAQRAATLVSHWSALLDEAATGWEIVLAGVAEADVADAVRHVTRRDRIRVVVPDSSSSFGETCRAGFAAASEGLVLYPGRERLCSLDDLRLMARHIDNADVVVGYRRRPTGEALADACGWLGDAAVRLLFGLAAHGAAQGAWLLRRDALAAIDLECETRAISVEMMAKFVGSGFRVAEARMAGPRPDMGAPIWETSGGALSFWREILEQWVKLVWLEGKYYSRHVSIARGVGAK